MFKKSSDCQSRMDARIVTVEAELVIRLKKKDQNWLEWLAFFVSHLKNNLNFSQGFLKSQKLNRYSYK